MTGILRFLLDDEVVELHDIAPATTVLEWLRDHRARTGTKEGCAEGDCGACTVVVGALMGDRVNYRAVNACIHFLPMLHGKLLLTVESLGGDHPVQKAMVALHGSQCGFCTPGIVMSLYARTLEASGTVDAEPKDVLAGNLCRCTGYGPILEAAGSCPAVTHDDGARISALKKLHSAEPLTLPGWTAPKTTEQLAQVLLEKPDSRIVAGGTDVGLWVTKQHRSLSDIVYLGDITDLSGIDEADEGVTLGAGVRYADAHAVLARLHPSLGELIRRVGGVQVRNSGTIGGNIANGSPIGDMPPALISLGASVTLRRGADRRTLPLEDFFITYGQQDRHPGEFVASVFIPRPTGLYRVTKLSKRFDSDISAVCGAFHLTLEAGIITKARVAFGGMAGTPKRARACETVLIGGPWSHATLDTAARALGDDYQPLSDVRGSADYRLTAAGNLVRKLWFDDASVLDVGAIDA